VESDISSIAQKQNKRAITRHGTVASTIASPAVRTGWQSGSDPTRARAATNATTNATTNAPRTTNDSARAERVQYRSRSAAADQPASAKTHHPAQDPERRVPAGTGRASRRVVKSPVSAYFIPPSHMDKAQNALPKQGPFATVRALCGMRDAASINLTAKKQTTYGVNT
jgi:hypothetical protein